MNRLTIMKALLLVTPGIDIVRGSNHTLMYPRDGVWHQNSLRVRAFPRIIGLLSATPRP